MKEKTIEETYQKKTPLEHILLRPDTYVGSIEMEKVSRWVLPEEATKFECHDIVYVPALYKIFDEVLVNAADNYQRDRKMNLLKVEINQAKGFVSVHNNGKGIPVEMHKKQQMYVPELIFGHLLTGSNYNDEEKKVVGGRNGYGAKLANIFSTRFVVECADGKNRKKFTMSWSKNMTLHSNPEISPYTGKDFTTITFYPEFSRFKMTAFDDNVVSLFKKRVYDMAGLLPTVKVFLNEKQIPENTFLKYVSMYFPSDSEVPRVRDSEVDNERWQVVVATSDGEFKQVSFVNSICTSKGGTHVNYITEQMVDRIQEKLKKKDKNLDVKPFQIKAHLLVFVNCLIENPAFDSQTKQTLTLKASQFGSECQLSERFIKEVLRTGIVDEIFNEAKAKQLQKLAKMSSGGKKTKITGIPKLEDANEAGSKNNSSKCTLILTEGDSAKSLAMAGIEVIGRDFYGVFPLKGKLLNVRQAPTKTISQNEQIQNIIKILGLQIGKTYEDTKMLRYGALMIMSDQDTDGSHIKGLVINFIHTFWPSLFKMKGFLKQFITPLLKVSKANQCISFYTMRDFKVWAEGNDLKGWRVKYYKGLGTSTDKEAMEYFENLSRNRIEFKYEDQEDEDAMDLIFNKKNAEKRKDWLSRYDPTAVMVYDRPVIRYKQFVEKEFIHFSNEDNCRSIASVIDGFKPGQRKIMFACFKRNLKEEIKVAQLAGYVAEHSAYHHGEISLTMTIVNMAQDFVGSNNINLLMPNGQFGSRNQGGKDHASARYIFTNLNKVTRFIYPESDDHTLTYIEDDGQFVEPEFYMPIIPMGLVNGCEGIGSGWSTFIPNYNPRQIAQMLQAKLQHGEALKQLNPWYKGYSGDITRKEDGNFEVKGRFLLDETDPDTIHITELPINKWTKDYKIFLDEIMQHGDTKIMGLKEYHTKNKVHFELQMNPEFIGRYREDTSFLEKFFKLNSNLSMKNMVGFNQRKLLHKYCSSVEIMSDFFHIRLEYYERRKEYLVSRLVREVRILAQKQRFIIEIVEESLIIRNAKKVKLVELLKSRGYTYFKDFPAVKSTKVVRKEEKKEEAEPDNQPDDPTDNSKQYNYLLSLPLWSLTYEKVEEIKKNKNDKNQELNILASTTCAEMWNRDLVEFLLKLDEVEKEEEQERLKGEAKAKGQKGQKARKKNVDAVKAKDKPKPKKKQGVNWDSQSEVSVGTADAKAKRGPSKKKTQQDKTQLDKTQHKPKAKAKQAEKPKEKPVEVPKEAQDDNSFLNRIKKMQASNHAEVSLPNTQIMTKPSNISRKPQDMYTVGDGKDFSFVQVPVVGSSNKKKVSKMQVDSDSSSYSGSGSADSGSNDEEE